MFVVPLVVPDFVLIHVVQLVILIAVMDAEVVIVTVVIAAGQDVRWIVPVFAQVDSILI